MSTQQEFLESVFLSNAVRDALSTRGGQRVYKDKKPTDKARTAVGSALKSKLRSLAWQYYSRKVDDPTHIKNIEELALYVSTTCRAFLNGKLFFGVAQKALNVYLKYLWCWDPNFIPPHCPFDDKIIKALGTLPVGCHAQWTTSDSATSYRAWVAAARAIAGTHSLAEWELDAWS